MIFHWELVLYNYFSSNKVVAFVPEKAEYTNNKTMAIVYDMVPYSLFSQMVISLGSPFLSHHYHILVTGT